MDKYTMIEWMLLWGSITIAAAEALLSKHSDEVESAYLNSFDLVGAFVPVSEGF